MKFSLADSRVKMWFSDVSGTNSVPIYRCAGGLVAPKLIGFGATKPPAHPEGGTEFAPETSEKLHILTRMSTQKN